METVYQYLLHYRKGNSNHKLGTGFFICKTEIIKVEFVSVDQLSYLLEYKKTFLFFFFQNLKSKNRYLS